ncbi:hypothetical protein NQ314_007072 [Rhamnusium bicolor]|uniref:Uncharacterized protein n=1 Tax=Rhamnusium bicolor TaxID=1586634 RepID=A0AAV8YSD2_9CUCU|nr:hypothetical protein NQ314_007072 [Rhamnusium bicolor]
MVVIYRLSEPKRKLSRLVSSLIWMLQVN